MQVTSVLVHSNSKLGIPNSYWQLINNKIKILCFLINCRTLIKKKDSFGKRCQLFKTLVSPNKKQKKSLHTMLFAFRVATDRISETQVVLQCILSPDFQKNFQVSLAHIYYFWANISLSSAMTCTYNILNFTLANASVGGWVSMRDYN